MSISIGLAQPSELPAVLELLHDCDLPEASLGARTNTLLFTAQNDGRLVGCAALELYGAAALLRSVAVSEAARGTGLGGRLTDHVLRMAQQLNVVEMYLLTDTAERFFSRRGFRVIERSAVPATVLQSPEFSVPRCASAPVMVKRLGGE